MDIPTCRCVCLEWPLKLSSCFHSRLWIWGFFLICLSAIIAAENGALIFLPTVDEQKILFADDKFVVTCYPREGTNAYRITWKGPSGEITDRTGRIHVEESQKDKGIDLFFDGITMRDQGQYNCTAIVDDDDVVKSFDIVVFKRITFINIQETQFVSEGTDQTISCKAQAYPDPQITWKINENEITKYKHEVLYDGLRIRNITREDAGVYVCRATLMHEVISDFQELKIDVIVQYKPDWKEPVMDTYYSYVGGIVNLTCEADGIPEPKYIWFQKGNPVENFPIYEGNGKSILEIRIQNESYFDNYTCNADNNQGSIDLTIQLVPGAKPPVPHIEVTESDTESITLSISMNNKGELEVLGYTVQIKKEAESWMSREFTVDKEVLKNDHFVLKNLNAGTSYHIRAAARNIVGLGEYSTEIIHSTQEPQEPPPAEKFDISTNKSKQIIARYSLVMVGAAAFLLGLAL